jgi:amino acid transporter
VVAAVRALHAGLGEGTWLSMKPFYDPSSFSFGSTMAATSIAVFSYLGFDGVSTLAEDSYNPRTDIGRATVFVCLLCGALFILQAYLGQLAWPDYSSYPKVETAILDVSRLVGGDHLLWFVTLVLMVAGIASAVTGQASASRLLFGMGRDRLLPPRIFAYIHPKYSTPTYSVLFMGTLTFAGGFFLSFQLAAEAINFGALIGFMGVNLSVISHCFLRRRQRQGPTMAYNLFFSLGGFLVCAYVFVSLSTTAKIVGAVWCAAGLMYAFVLTGGFRRGIGVVVPDSPSLD